MIVVLAEVEALPFQLGQLGIETGELGDDVASGRRITLLVGQLQQDLGVIERRGERAGVGDDRLVARQPARDLQCAVPVVPQVGCGRLLPQLGELGLLLVDVKGTSGRRRGGSGGPSGARAGLGPWSSGGMVGGWRTHPSRLLLHVEGCDMPR